HLALDGVDDHPVLALDERGGEHVPPVPERGLPLLVFADHQRGDLVGDRRGGDERGRGVGGHLAAEEGVVHGGQRGGRVEARRRRGEGLRRRRWGRARRWRRRRERDLHGDVLGGHLVPNDF